MSSGLLEENGRKKDDLSLVELLLQNRSDNEELLEYCNYKLKILLESDQKNGTEYIKTLQTYLETGRSLAVSAERLYVHRNTVLQRIRKITELLQIDLRDFTMANEYYLMLKILEDAKERE